MKFQDLKPFDFSLVVSETDTVFTHIVKETNKAFKFYGLDDWTISFDHAKKRAGCCSYMLRSISLSTCFVKGMN